MKARLPLFLGVLMAASVAVQASQKAGGDDAYYIDTRPPVSNNIVVEWSDAKARGGDAYVKPIMMTSEVKVYYVAPVMKGGDK